MVPSGFKECLDAEKIALCIAGGIKRVLPEAEVIQLPMADGGEGFVRTLTSMTNGQMYRQSVTGPTGEKVEGYYGILGGEGPLTAVIEMAAAAGLKLVPKTCRNPLYTTTYGVGELIQAALNHGVERILLGCGDSGTSDGGIGMARALGVRFFDKTGKELAVHGGKDLIHIHKIDVSDLNPCLSHVQIDVACNWHNRLCGDEGVARVFGPQKGATEHEIIQLEAGFDHYANIIEKSTGFDVRSIPGGGASGGLGAGLKALAGANLYPRYDIIMQYIDFQHSIKQADLVFTAEGCIDDQTPKGKIPAEVAKAAQKHKIPVIALTGSIGSNAQINYQFGIHAFTSILQTPGPIEKAFSNCEDWLKDSAESTIRTILVGYQLALKQNSQERVS